MLALNRGTALLLMQAAQSAAMGTTLMLTPAMVIPLLLLNKPLPLLLQMVMLSIINPCSPNRGTSHSGTVSALTVKVSSIWRVAATLPRMLYSAG
jgi:hypothetical protein